jgi:hypothetical protein
MKPSQTIRFGAAAVVLALLLAACAVHPSAPDSASGSPTPETSSNPPTEPATGTESPRSPTSGAIAISMAPAPTGKQGNSGDNDQCIQASWLGNPIPRGDIVTITSAAVHRPFTFDPAVTAQCEGGPSCVNYRFSADNDSGQFCNVGLGYRYGSIDLDGSEAHGTLELVGYLSCPPNISSAACHHDAAAMQRPGIGTVSFEVFTIDKTSTPSSSAPESPPSSSATPVSSSPTAPGSP